MRLSLTQGARRWVYFQLVDSDVVINLSVDHIVYWSVVDESKRTVKIGVSTGESFVVNASDESIGNAIVQLEPDGLPVVMQGTVRVENV